MHEYLYEDVSCECLYSCMYYAYTENCTQTNVLYHLPLSFISLSRLFLYLLFLLAPNTTMHNFPLAFSVFVSHIICPCSSVLTLGADLTGLSSKAVILIKFALSAPAWRVVAQSIGGLICSISRTFIRTFRETAAPA